MALKLEHIDRAIEWTLRDVVISKGYWPDQRTFITNDDEAGFNAALAALTQRIDVFGVGNYKDREQLLKNNIIIDRDNGIGDGMVGHSFPYRFDLNPNKTYKKVYVGEGSSNVEYEIRFVADDVNLDRVINMIVQEAIGKRKQIFGMNDDFTWKEESFYIERNGPAVDLSDKDFLERVFRFVVKDVILDEEKTTQNNIPPIKSITTISNIDPEDPTYPEDRNDVTETESGVVDYLLGLVEATSAWQKFLVARLYANDTQGNALKDIKNKGAAPAVNSGLTFTPYVGFSKTAAPQFLNTLFQPSANPGFGLTSFSYMVFVTSIPAGGVMELFGLSDLLQPVGFFLSNDNGAPGLTAKGNSNNLLTSSIQVKANTLYTLNSRNRFQLELFEGDRLLKTLELEPTAKPNGTFAELNIFNQAGAAIGTGTAGGLAFSAIGEGLKGSEIREFNSLIRLFMTRLGIIP